MHNSRSKNIIKISLFWIFHIYDIIYLGIIFNINSNFKKILLVLYKKKQLKKNQIFTLLDFHKYHKIQYLYWILFFSLDLNRKIYRVFLKYCVFFEDFEIFRSLFPSVLMCVHTPDRWNTSPAAELAEFRKITKF